MNMLNEINPFDILSGKVVRTKYGTFWFKEPGYNLQYDNWPILANLHREDDLPAAIFDSGTMWWIMHGHKHRLNGPAVIWLNGNKEWWKYGICTGTSSS